MMSDRRRRHQHGRFLLAGLIGLGLLGPVDSYAQVDMESRPSLIITNEPLPIELRKQVYTKPKQVRTINPGEVTGRSYYTPMQTAVTQKIGQINNNIGSLQSSITSLSQRINDLQRSNEEIAADYYSAIATINTQLQSGTTPGNPRLTQKVADAEASLENLAGSISVLNQLASDLASSAAESAFLLEQTRAAYGLSGAIEEDHVRLAELEDSIHNTTVIIERLLNTVSDDITRTNGYLATETNNLRTLSLAVSNGDLYGRSLANRPFSHVPQFENVSAGATAPVSAGAAYSSASTPRSARPLVKIRFDHPDVNYEQPVYMAVSEALQRYPNIRFELVAVHPTKGNAAQVAIESTRARRNAERVMRTLTQMGLPMDRVDLSYDQSVNAETNEVHIYVR